MYATLSSVFSFLLVLSFFQHKSEASFSLRCISGRDTSSLARLASSYGFAVKKIYRIIVCVCVLELLQQGLVDMFALYEAEKHIRTDPQAPFAVSPLLLALTPLPACYMINLTLT